MMIPDQILRFTFNDVYHGLAECYGNLFLETNYVVIEYFLKDSLFGVIKSDVKVLKIPYSEIFEAEIKSKFFSKKLVLKIKSLRNLTQIPFANEEGELIFKIKNKKDSLIIAETIASYINYRISENKLYNLENNF